MAEHETPDFKGFSKGVPVYGTAECGPGKFSIDMNNGDEIDWVRKPPALLSKKGIYAIYAEGTSMEPRIEAGELLYVDPHRKPEPGRDCVIQLRQRTENGHPIYMLKRLIRRGPTKWTFKQLNPEKDIILEIREFDAVHLVLKMHEILGI